MRSPADMNIAQIEITNFCHSLCSNCTRLIGHYREDQKFFMSIECIKKAIDSYEGFPGIVGFIGGDPVISPFFEEACLYLEQKVKDPTKRGLWSSAPERFFKHFDLIQRVFPKWQFINERGIERGRPDIKTAPSLHTPIMVAVKDVVKDEKEMWELIDKCWLQELWSCTVAPKGAFVCEIMAQWDNLYDGPGGLPVEKGWWKIKPEDPKFQEQVKRYCPDCGACVPAERRKSSDIVDDISKSNLVKLTVSGSPKVKDGKYVEFDCDNYDASKHSWHPNSEWYLSGGAKDRVSKETREKFNKTAQDHGIDISALRETAGNKVKE